MSKQRSELGEALHTMKQVPAHQSTSGLVWGRSRELGAGAEGPVRRTMVPEGPEPEGCRMRSPCSLGPGGENE